MSFLTGTQAELLYSLPAAVTKNTWAGRFAVYGFWYEHRKKACAGLPLGAVTGAEHSWVYGATLASLLCMLLISPGRLA
jgi:hypothetical protein